MHRRCSIFFLTWWTIFICIVHQQLAKPHRSWHLAKTTNQQTKTLQTTPIFFKNASVQWLDMTNDAVALDIGQHSIFGTSNITNAHMQVFEDQNRTALSEIYNIVWKWTKHTHTFSFVQNDVHLSPYRRIVLHPNVDWDIGTSQPAVTQLKFGRFIKNTWQEGYDRTTTMGIAFVAWFVGLMFVIFTRPRWEHRTKRIFVK